MVKNLRAPPAKRSHTSETVVVNDNDVPEFQVPTETTKKIKLPDGAPVQLALLHYSDNSAVCGLPGYPDKVVVITMAHKAKSSLFSKQKESFEQFMKDTNATRRGRAPWAGRPDAPWVVSSELVPEWAAPHACVSSWG